MGFWEVGLAPVTTQDQRDYAITPEGKDSMLSQFEVLAQEWLQCALRDEHHGFSNVKDTLEEIHKGVSKAYGCGAGLGLMGVATDGDVALCHRFAGSPEHKIGSVTEGIDSQATVTMRIESGGQTYTGRGASTDTMEASAKAYLSAVNRMLASDESASLPAVGSTPD